MIKNISQALLFHFVNSNKSLICHLCSSSVTRQSSSTCITSTFSLSTHFCQQSFRALYFHHRSVAVAITVVIRLSAITPANLQTATLAVVTLWSSITACTCGARGQDPCGRVPLCRSDSSMKFVFRLLPWLSSLRHRARDTAGKRKVNLQNMIQSKLFERNVTQQLTKDMFVL